MLEVSITFDEAFNRAELEKFMKLTKGAEVLTTLNDNLEIDGIWARIDG